MDASSQCGDLPGGADRGATLIAKGKDHHRVRLSMGQRRTTGYLVNIRDPEPFTIHADVAEIRVRWGTPDGDAMVGQALTTPCVDVDVPSRYRGVRFFDRDGQLRGEAVWEP